MGKLEDLQFQKTDKGHLRICGKIRQGNDVFSGCIVVAAEGVGEPTPLEGEGHPEVQRELLKFVKENVKVR
jgi:hypothetical protein